MQYSAFSRLEFFHPISDANGLPIITPDQRVQDSRNKSWQQSKNSKKKKNESNSVIIELTADDEKVGSEQAPPLTQKPDGHVDLTI